MPCACGSRKISSLLFHARDADGDPGVWGPPLWAILHRIAGRVGTSESPVIDKDHAWHIEFLVNGLPNVLPCETCQAHCRAYLKTHPFSCSSLVGPPLNDYVRSWLFQFHNAVRESKNQPIEITNVGSLAALYEGPIPECDMNVFIAHVAYGVRTRLVKADNWKRWSAVLKRFKLMIGL
jgi:hypothetical protein